MEEARLYHKPIFFPHLVAVRPCGVHDGHTALGRHLASRAVLAGHDRIAAGPRNRSSHSYQSGIPVSKERSSDGILLGDTLVISWTRRVTVAKS